MILNGQELINAVSPLIAPALAEHGLGAGEKFALGRLENVAALNDVEEKYVPQVVDELVQAVADAKADWERESAAWAARPEYELIVFGNKGLSAVQVCDPAVKVGGGGQNPVLLKLPSGAEVEVTVRGHGYGYPVSLDESVPTDVVRVFPAGTFAVAWRDAPPAEKGDTQGAYASKFGNRAGLSTSWADLAAHA